MTEPVVLDEYVAKLLSQQALIYEARIKLLLRPRPWWLPGRLYMWIVSKVLLIEEQRTGP